MSLINHNYNAQLSGDATLNYDAIIQPDFKGEITFIQAAVTLQSVSIVVLIFHSKGQIMWLRHPASRLAEGWNDCFSVGLRGDFIKWRRKKNKPMRAMGFMSG